MRLNMDKTWLWL